LDVRGSGTSKDVARPKLGEWYMNKAVYGKTHDVKTMPGEEELDHLTTMGEVNVDVGRAETRNEQLDLLGKSLEDRVSASSGKSDSVRTLKRV